MASTGKFVEELSFSGPFDPIKPAVRTQIFTKLSTAKNATIVQLRQEGGLNEGLWVLSGASGNFILKLVPHDRRHFMMPSEAEQFLKLVRDHPAMSDDPALAFPLKIFYCRDQERDKLIHDLIVMRKAPGHSIADIIGRRWFMNKKVELMRELYALGAFLAEVHARHHMQHGDFTPSNVFYDEVSGAFTMVDLSDFGPQFWESSESDVERFCVGIDMLAKCYGEQLRCEGKQHFVRGYQESKPVLTC
jgi:serine/threonine protein kinase